MTNIVTFNCQGGWEIIGTPISVRANSNCTLSVIVKAPSFTPLFGYNGLALMVLSGAPSSSSNLQSQTVLGITQITSSMYGFATVNFNSGSNTTVYLVLNGGYIADGQEISFEFSSWQLQTYTSSSSSMIDQHIVPDLTTWIKYYNGNNIRITSSESSTQSKAINAKSFANYIAKTCRFIGGSSLDTNATNTLISFLTEGISNTSVAINISTAFKMVNKLRNIVELEKVAGSGDKSLLSYNTAKQIISYFLPTSSVSAFTTLNKYYTTSGKGGAGAVGRFIRIAPTNGGTATLNYKLVAGGGGGGGSTTGGGDKNSSYTVTGGAGGKGGNSIIYINGVAKVTATGGAGGAGSTEKAGGNPTMYKNGTSGSAGQTLTGSINIGTRDSITIGIGAGGGGGGGAAAVAGGSTSGRSPWVGGNGGAGVTFNGTNPNSPGGNGGAGATASNEWVGSECALSGGGGGGGMLGQAGSTWHSDNPNKCGGLNAATIGGEWLGGNGAGGKGAITAGGGSGGAGIVNQTTAGWNGSQPSTWGAGGIYGHGYAKGDTYSVSCGGNGGNAGGFAPTGGNALDILMFYKSS